MIVLVCTCFSFNYQFGRFLNHSICLVSPSVFISSINQDIQSPTSQYWCLFEIFTYSIANFMVSPIYSSFSSTLADLANSQIIPYANPMLGQYLGLAWLSTWVLGPNLPNVDIYLIFAKILWYRVYIHISLQFLAWQLPKSFHFSNPMMCGVSRFKPNIECQPN